MLNKRFIKINLIQTTETYLKASYQIFIDTTYE